MRDGQEGAHGDARQEYRGGLGLVLEPQLVRFGTAVHPGEGAKDGVDDEIRPADREENQRGHGNAQRDADRSKVIVACRRNSMKRADKGHN